MRKFEVGDVTVVRAVIPNPNAADDSILLLRRRPDAFNNPGQWEIPGGKLKTGVVPAPEHDALSGERIARYVVGNQLILDGGIREIEEETGYEVTISNNNISLIEHYEMEGGARHGGLYVAYAGVARYLGGELKISDEHTEAAWVTPIEAMKRHDVTVQTMSALSLHQDLKLGLFDLF